MPCRWKTTIKIIQLRWLSARWKALLIERARVLHLAKRVLRWSNSGKQEDSISTTGIYSQLRIRTDLLWIKVCFRRYLEWPDEYLPQEQPNLQLQNKCLRKEMGLKRATEERYRKKWSIKQDMSRKKCKPLSITDILTRMSEECHPKGQWSILTRSQVLTVQCCFRIIASFLRQATTLNSWLSGTPVTTTMTDNQVSGRSIVCVKS